MQESHRAQMTATSNQMLKLLEKSEKDGTLQIAAGAMAHALQMQFSLPHSPIKHSGALDVIMRAVAHAIEDDPSMKGYILNKLNVGHEQLKGSLR